VALFLCGLFLFKKSGFQSPKKGLLSESEFLAAQIEPFSHKNLNNFVKMGSYGVNYFNEFKFVSYFT